jgi:hypothetical protein
MDTKTSELTAARTELQTHLANVERTLFAAHTAQTIRTAMDRADARLTGKIERLEEQQRALRGILELICNRLGEREPAGSLPKQS